MTWEEECLDRRMCHPSRSEEAAQRLYKQWFIDLRFPGHETTKIVDGIPQGWRKGGLADIVRDVGINEKKENRANYSYYLPIDCLPKKNP